MQQQQQQQGGSQYGADMGPFVSPGAGPRTNILGIPTGPDHHPHHLPPPQQQQPNLVAEVASPISSRPPPLAPTRANFDELVPAAAGAGNFPDEDALAAGEEAERGGVPGNRWPRQETLALLKIRSEMDAAFRDATLKGPLWDDVSRKLAELGFLRSAKKCKEKFENVHKYYKRTKEGRAGRQDGKSYRFFPQLEALHSGGTPTTTAPMANPITTATMAHPITSVPALTAAAAPATASPSAPIGISSSSSMAGPSMSRPQPPLISPPVPSTAAPPAPTACPPGISSSATAAAAGISFSSDTCSSSSSESDDEGTEEGVASMEGSRKRKRGGGSSGGSRKMMAFFDGLMKQMMERQEVMQQRFLETIEKREQDRMIREEAWKRQEMARLNREHEIMAQERAMAVSRDAAVISFLQKISGQPIQIPPAIPVPVAPLPQPSPSAPPPPPPPQQQHPPPQPPQHPLQHHQKPPAQPQLPSQAQPQQLPSAPPQPQPPPRPPQQQQQLEIVRHQPSSTSTELVPVPEPHEVVASGGFEGVSSSRWPKPEVHALIKLRSDLESRYQEAGPKGPLWEEISAGMHRLGYNRSSKRCKEKWENINKYFKKVKESNKKRPEDAKTCPYFHQLDALYRKKLIGSTAAGVSSSSSSFGGGVMVNQRPQEQDAPNPNPIPQERSDVLLSMAPPPQQQHPHPETESKNGSGGIQIQTSNGGITPNFFEEGASGSATMKKPEDIVKELMEQEHQQDAMDDYDKLEEPDSDNMDDDDDDEDDDEESKMQYKIQFQRQNVGGGGNGSANATGAATGTAAGSFFAMVQ